MKTGSRGCDPPPALSDRIPDTRMRCLTLVLGRGWPDKGEGIRERAARESQDGSGAGEPVQPSLSRLRNFEALGRKEEG
eukprot:3937594-Rhodomonas_salina.2